MKTSTELVTHQTLLLRRWCLRLHRISNPLPSNNDANTESETSHSVAFLWTSDQPDADTFSKQDTKHRRDIHSPGKIRTHSLSKWAVANTSLGPRGRWDRLGFQQGCQNSFQKTFRTWSGSVCVMRCCMCWKSLATRIITFYVRQHAVL